LFCWDSGKLVLWPGPVPVLRWKFGGGRGSRFDRNEKAPTGRTGAEFYKASKIG